MWTNGYLLAGWTPTESCSDDRGRCDKHSHCRCTQYPNLKKNHNITVVSQLHKMGTRMIRVSLSSRWPPGALHCSWTSEILSNTVLCIKFVCCLLLAVRTKIPPQKIMGRLHYVSKTFSAWAAWHNLIYWRLTKMEESNVTIRHRYRQGLQGAAKK